MTKTKLAAAALAVLTSATFAGQAFAASHHARRAAPGQSEQLINRPVALPYSYGTTGEDFGRYSGPFRTDASPNSGGS
jgi:hypothetical protein